MGALSTIRGGRGEFSSLYFGRSFVLTKRHKGFGTALHAQTYSGSDIFAMTAVRVSS